MVSDSVHTAVGGYATARSHASHRAGYRPTVPSGEIELQRKTPSREHTSHGSRSILTMETGSEGKVTGDRNNAGGRQPSAVCISALEHSARIDAASSPRQTEGGLPTTASTIEYVKSTSLTFQLTPK